MARFEDRSQAERDVLIGADGLRSTVRSWVAPTIRPEYTGYVARRGLAAESRLGNRTRARVFPEFCLCLPPGE